MENASKALIMAASVLISLVIIGALVLMFNNLTTYQKTETEGTRDAQVVEFNNQYETYNRKNVRGSDLYSLLNKVVDYNRRKSEVGTGTNDQGQYLAFEPMTIRYDLNGKQGELVFDKEIGNQIFTSGYTTFTLTQATSNGFEQYIIGKIKPMKDIAKNEVAMQNLSAGIANLFDKGNDSDRIKLAAIKLWNANVNTANQTNEDADINVQYGKINTTTNKKAVNAYYEFMQFKRAHFNCESDGNIPAVAYNSGTGRIISMNFEFTGKIN